MAGVPKSIWVKRFERVIAVWLACGLALCCNPSGTPTQNRLLAAPSALVPLSSGGEKLTWLRFAEPPQRRPRARIPFHQLHQEKKRIRLTVLANESGEDRIRASDFEQADLSPIEGPLYVISDVHLNGKKAGGLEQWKYVELKRFFRKVAESDGNLIVNGDFFELFINPSFLIKHLHGIYNDLRRIKRVIYIRGNHDDQLQPLVGKRWKNISFLDSISIPVNGKVVHIEHGHLSDWWWHHKSEQGGKVIQFVHWAAEHGINLPLWYGFFINWLFFIVIPLQLPQWFRMDRRIREVRKAMPPQLGFSETMKPLSGRFWHPIRGLRRLWWELFAKKSEPELVYVVGHHHDADQWIFATQFFQWLNGRRTRVKLHFTAGCWESHFCYRPLYYTRIDPDGRIEKLEVGRMTGTAAKNEDAAAEPVPGLMVETLLPIPREFFPANGKGSRNGHNSGSPRHHFYRPVVADIVLFDSAV